MSDYDHTLYTDRARRTGGGHGGKPPAQGRPPQRRSPQVRPPQVRPPQGGHTHKKRLTLKQHIMRLISRALRTPVIPIAVLVIIAALAVWAVVWAFTNKNAYEVFVNDTSVGVIAMDKKAKLSADDLSNNAVIRLKQENSGSNVQIAETVTTMPVHSNKKNEISVESAIDAICGKVTYTVEAQVISVDGIEICAVKNQQSVDNVETSIINAYIPDGKNIVDKGFVNTVDVKDEFVDKSEILTDDKAIVKLTATTATETPYTVAKGDSVWSLCNQYNISQDDVMALNPGLVPESLQPGTTIKLPIKTPLLSVKTVEEITDTVSVPRTVVQQVNNAKPAGYSQVIQEGADGSKTVTVRITYINGVETGRDETNPGENTVPPTPKIIEVGGN